MSAKFVPVPRPRSQDTLADTLDRAKFVELAQKRMNKAIPPTLNLKTAVRTQAVGLRPKIELEPPEHLLSIEQRDGTRGSGCMRSCRLPIITLDRRRNQKVRRGIRAANVKVE